MPNEVSQGTLEILERLDEEITKRELQNDSGRQHLQDLKRLRDLVRDTPKVDMLMQLMRMTGFSPWELPGK